MMATVSFGLRSASSPTFLTDFGVDLALHLRDIDHRRGAVRDVDVGVAADQRDVRPAG